MSYASEVLADSPTVYYPLHSVSAGVWADSSGNGHDLNTTSGTAPTLNSTGGPDGLGAMVYGASAGHIRTSFTQSPPNVGTYEAWVYLASSPSAEIGIAAWSPTSGASGAPSLLRVRSDGKISTYNTPEDIVSASALGTGSWHHIVASWGAAGHKIRIDKTTVATGTDNSAPAVVSSFRLHGFYFPSSDLSQTGAISYAHVAFYPTQLSDARTDAHYNAMFAAKTGSLAATLPTPDLAFTGTYTPPAQTGTLSVTLPTVEAAFTGTYTAPPTGTLAAVLPVPEASFTGTYTPPAVPTGSLDAVLPVPVVAFTGDYHPHESGTLDVTLPVPVPDFTGTYTPAAITGTLDVVLPVPEVAFEGITGDILGSFGVVLPLPVVAFTGVYGGPYPTDTSNLFDGLDLVGVATVTIIRPAAAVPPSLTPAARYDVALPYPEPVMVNGRPT